MKKSKKTGSDYYNYKGLFSLVLLALVDAEYRFLWIDCWSSDSCSDAQIFNRSLLREKMKDSSLGLPPPEPLGEGGPDLHCFLVGDAPFPLCPGLSNPTAEDNDQGRKNSQLQDLQGQEVGGKRKGQGLSETLYLHVWCCTTC